MKQTISSYQFRRAFEDIRPDNFSYEALGALFEYYEEYERDSGEETELDVIAICCDWTEYSNIELIREYLPASDYEPSDDITDADDVAAAQLEAVMAYLHDETEVIELSDGAIVTNR